MDKELRYRLTLKDFFKKTMIGAQNETKRLDDGMNKLNSTIGRVGKMVGGYFAASSLFEFGQDVVRATAEMQGFNNAIMASSRTEEEGRYNIKYLNSEVDRLGISLDAAKSGYKTFTGAAMGTTIQGAKANKVFTQVAESATVMGLSAEQQEGAFLALGQMLSKGTVQAEELRGQLGERIPGAFQIGARAMKMTTGQLAEAMKQGLIESSEFVQKFGDELQRTFGDKLENATHSVQSNLNRMGTSWQRLQVEIGNSQSGVIASTTNFVNEMLSALGNYFKQANIMHDNFKKSAVEDFNFWQKLGHETIGVLSGYNYGLSSIQQQENFQKDAYKLTSPKNAIEGYRNKASLYQMSLDMDKKYASGEIDKTEADRFQATIKGALEELNNSLQTFKLNDPKGKKEELGKKKETAAIGTSTEVYGSRPQNVIINLDRLGDVNMTVNNMQEGAAETREEFSKKLLEVLNDANMIATR